MKKQGSQHFEDQDFKFRIWQSSKVKSGIFQIYPFKCFEMLMKFNPSLLSKSMVTEFTQSKWYKTKYKLKSKRKGHCSLNSK